MILESETSHHQDLSQRSIRRLCKTAQVPRTCPSGVVSQSVAPAVGKGEGQSDLRSRRATPMCGE